MRTSYLLLSALCLLGCSKKNEAPPQPTSEAMQTSQWACTQVTVRTLKPDGTTLNATAGLGTFGIRFTPSEWHLTRMTDRGCNCGFSDRVGTYKYTGTVLTLSPGTAFKVNELTNDKLTITEVFNADADGNHSEIEYQSVRR